MKTFFTATLAEDVVSNPRNLERPRKIFGEYLFENEIGILFADSNAGKTLIADDIAIAADSGRNYWGEVMCEIEGERNIVIYDLELSQKQFTARYADKGFEFGSITRVEFDARNIEELTVADFLNDVEERINDRCYNLFIIDNLSCIMQNTVNANEAKEIMRGLKMLKELHENLSFLVLAHTTKRKMSSPISQNDLGGSKFLMNFCDSAFALGMSVIDEDLRYLKQIKTRTGEKKNLVASLSIEASPYLHMEFVDWTEEQIHLESYRKRKGIISDLMGDHILELRADGYSYREIASETGISKSSVQRFLAENEAND